MWNVIFFGGCNFVFILGKKFSNMLKHRIFITLITKQEGSRANTSDLYSGGVLL
jgi:hypothetical protein